MDRIELTHEPIDFSDLTESVRSTTCGAVILFLGTVRELTRGRGTDSLDYSAYPAMAQAKLEELVAQAREQWPIERAAIVHRLGHMGPGEVSVAIAVASPHRTDAFDAGRFLIDTLKEVVPIWKKENWSDGTTEWVHPGVEPTADTPISAEDA